MKDHTKRILLFIAAISATCSLVARPRVVDFDKEMSHAKFIGLIVVDSYDGKGNILFHSIEFTDTIKSAFIHYYGRDGYRFPYGYGDTICWTGNLPFKRDTVLIVIDSLNKVSIFAKKINTDYRFWSPYLTRSTALFDFSKPAKKLSGFPDLSNSDKFESCWDGCLLPVNQLFLVTGKIFIHSGTAMMISGAAVFASDFADSAIYYLDGLNKWDEKYLNKRIKISGELVTENNKTIFKNWKIIE